MVQRLRVNQFYTTPSAIRKLMKADEEFVTKYNLSSLKTIGSGVWYKRFLTVAGVLDYKFVYVVGQSNFLSFMWRGSVLCLKLPYMCTRITQIYSMLHDK